MEIYIGAENIISPLGNTAKENFDAVVQGNTGVAKHEKAGVNGQALFLSKFSYQHSFDTLLQQAFETLEVSDEVKSSVKTKIIISSTKGTIGEDISGSLKNVFERFMTNNKLENKPLLISNACISGVLAIVKAGELIKKGIYDHVIVIGCDLVTDFIVYGFEALFALSDDVCRPFDKNRKGINLGEGCGAVVLSNDKTVFKEKPVRYLGGTSSNDANHISGPSRTGEGLFRSVTRTLKKANIKSEEIDFISAHGTATLYNDNMESIAFHRLGMSDIKLNSFKAYFGHTLGAAGVIEVAMAIQSMKNQKLIKSLGFEEKGTEYALNMITATEKAKVQTVLKTSSGFGGANATLILQQ